MDCSAGNDEMKGLRVGVFGKDNGKKPHQV